MRFGRTLLGVASGLALASLAATVVPTGDAEARRRRSGAMKLKDVNVGGESGVPLNATIEFKFTQRIDRASANHALIQIRAENANGTGFTKQVPGSFQIRGSTVIFFPRLPTHLRDPDAADGSFYGVGTARDDASENSGLQPDTNYEIKVIGHPEATPVRSNRGRRLNRTTTETFTTAPDAPLDFTYTTETYQDNPPPQFVLSNPADKVAGAIDQYARHGGTVQVQADIAISIFGNRVPLNPTLLRQGDNLSLTMLERKGDPSARQPIKHATFLEQNFDTTHVVVQPNVPLPDIAVFAVRMKKEVKDLTNQFDFQNNAERLRLRSIYEFLETARTLNPQTPAEQLQDPPPDLTFDWPVDAASRGVLKRNVLELGDTYPDEVDPRVLVLFSTRDEPVSEGALTLEFVNGDGALNDALTTGSWDDQVPGAASAIMTIAAGSGIDGDYLPAASENINIDAFPDWTVNWRRVRIPPNVVVTVTGSRPATIKAIDIVLEGEIRADGLAGANAQSSGTLSANGWNLTRSNKGGAGGPGGGKGADNKSGTNSTNYPVNTLGTQGIGNTGTPGHDRNLVEADVDDGGRGGRGGLVGAGTYYNFGSAGGGGGARTAGADGANNTGGQATWRPNRGGAGGAGSNNADLDPFVGGAGGGSGGNAALGSNNWKLAAGAAGGGGGALRVQVAGKFEIGSQGVLRSRGGRGGNGTGSGQTLNAGPGGGGGGGSIYAATSGFFNIFEPGAAFDVRGGPGGTHSGNYVASPGGSGGEGYVRIADPRGAADQVVPNATNGDFNPVGGGVPSIVYTNWRDLGVTDPLVVNAREQDFVMNAGNDAIMIEVQGAVDDPTNFGTALTTSIDNNQNSTNTDEVTEWQLVRMLDNTGNATAAIPHPDYNKATMGTDRIFDYATALNDAKVRHVRYRITFQLDDTQSPSDDLPFVDRIDSPFQFNF